MLGYLKSIMHPTKKKIVILDDEPALREFVAQEMERQGYEAFQLESKAEGYDWIIANKPDLIISDVKSPGMDGMQFLKWLKANPYTSKVPFIFLTGFTDLRNAMEALRLGADDYVSKPFDISAFNDTVARVLKGGSPPAQDPSMIDVRGAVRSGEGKFLPWSTLKQMMRVALDRANERTTVLQENQTWEMDFVIEAEGKLFGGRFFRSLDLGIATSAEVVIFRYTLAEYGLDAGIIFNFFDASQKTRQLASLLGVHIAYGQAIDRVLDIGISSKSKTSIVSAIGVDVSQIGSCDDFIRLVNRILGEVHSHEGDKLIVEALDDHAGPTEVLITKGWNGGPGFTWSDEKKRTHVPFQIIWELCAMLWLKGRITREEFGLDAAARECLFSLLSSFSSVRCERDSIVLW